MASQSHLSVHLNLKKDIQATDNWLSVVRVRVRAVSETSLGAFLCF